MDNKKTRVNKNFTKLTQEKGISLIVLIVTIIVIIILAAVVLLTVSKNNPVDNAKKAVILSDISTLREQIEIKKIDNKYKDEKTNISKLFGSIDQVLGKEYSNLSSKYSVENDKVVYKDKKFSQKEIAILEENGVEKESNYLVIVNSNTKESENYKNNERAVTLKGLQDKITNKEFFSTGYNKAYVIEDIDVGARWSEDGTLISGESWSPITKIPQGTVLDGDNHKIKGIYINTNIKDQAFIVNNYGIIKNLIIDKDCYFKTTSSGLASLLLCNKEKASVINCVNYANVIAENKSSEKWEINWNISGIVSNNFSNIIKCTNYGDVYAKVGGYSIAGICPSISSPKSFISECINYGNVTGHRIWCWRNLWKGNV